MTDVWDGQQHSVGDEGDAAPGRPTASAAQPRDDSLAGETTRRINPLQYDGFGVVPPFAYCEHGYCESEHCRTCEIMGVCKRCEPT